MSHVIQLFHDCICFILLQGCGCVYSYRVLVLCVCVCFGRGIYCVCQGENKLTPVLPLQGLIVSLCPMYSTVQHLLCLEQTQTHHDFSREEKITWSLIFNFVNWIVGMYLTCFVWSGAVSVCMPLYPDTFILHSFIKDISLCAYQMLHKENQSIDKCIWTEICSCTSSCLFAHLK